MLFDVGVWLAAVWAGHVQHRRVAAWFEVQESSMYLCRVTQMSLLRLLSNPAVLGKSVLSRADAWRTVDQLGGDDRVQLIGEPAQLEQVWRSMSARNDNSHKLWTDAYLAAFAQTAGLSMVTLDTAFERRYPSVSVVTLTRS